MSIASRQRVSIAGPALRVDGSARRERGPEERGPRENAEPAERFRGVQVRSERGGEQ